MGGISVMSAMRVTSVMSVCVLASCSSGLNDCCVRAFQLGKKLLEAWQSKTDQQL
jgi:hypothetical protein